MELALVNQQFEELRAKYSGLSFVRWRGKSSIEGVLRFSAEFERHPIEDEYAIKISLPDNSPKTHPVAEEMLGRIPRSFHHYQDGYLCLGTPFAISKRFDESPTLLGFTEKSLIPYLYSFSYKSQYGQMPYGELSHGWLGVLENYSDEFGVNNPRVIVEFLKILADDYPAKYIKCPCNSRKVITACHGKQLTTMLRIRPALLFKKELIELINGITPEIKFTPFHNRSQPWS